jgi:hypothetical protein
MRIVLMIGVILFFFFLLCGVYASLSSVARGAGRIRSRLVAKPEPVVAGAAGGDPDDIDKLKSLFALYQQGALTKEEFDQLKRHLLSTLPQRACGS